jgi:hypothetical protein
LLEDATRRSFAKETRIRRKGIDVYLADHECSTLPAKRHLLGVSLDMIWEFADGDSIDYEEEFFPEMFVCGLEGKVIRILPPLWARAFDRDILQLSRGMQAEILQEVVSASTVIDGALVTVNDVFPVSVSPRL